VYKKGVCSVFRLLAVRASILALKRAIVISDKLSSRSWKLLVMCQCALLLLSIWGFQKSKGSGESQYSLRLRVKDSSPDASRGSHDSLSHNAEVMTAIEQPHSNLSAEHSLHPLASRAEAARESALKYATLANTLAAQGHDEECQTNLRLANDYQELAEVLMAYGDVENPVDYAEFFVRQHYVDFLGREPDESGRQFREGQLTESGTSLRMMRASFGRNPLSEYFSAATWLVPDDDYLIGFRRLLAPAATVAVSYPEGNDFKHALLFWVSLFGMIVSPITSIATVTFAGISLRRKWAEDELLQRLELDERRLRIEKLRLDLERAQNERAELNAASPKIVLLS
jgi:hypothetical protein